jgi:hypothetical protein
MSENDHAIKIKAAAYAAAGDLGVNKAIRLLEEAAAKLKDEQWNEQRN